MEVIANNVRHLQEVCMERVISEKVFVVDVNAADPTRPSYEICPSQELKLKEEWYRDAILKNPELVISPCRSVGLTDEDWYGWDCEVPVKSNTGEDIGKIDVLLVSNTGRIAIVETKLVYNPEKRREVVAQVLDYALNLTANLRVLQERLLPAKAPVKIDEVLDRLTEADYLLIIAGDQMDSRAVRLAATLSGTHSLSNWDLVTIDITMFKKVDSAMSCPDLLAVSSLRGKVVHEVRNVLQVNKNTGEVRIEPVKPQEERSASAAVFSWGDLPEEKVDNWADLMVRVCRRALSEGLTVESLPMPKSQTPKAFYRMVDNDIFITSRMNLRGASGYCEKILKALKKQKGFLKVTTADGSVYAFP